MAPGTRAGPPPIRGIARSLPVAASVTRLPAPAPLDRPQVFQRSIEGLRILNQHGYGAGGPCAKNGRRLDLVFNPPGPFLPPQQARLAHRVAGGIGSVKRLHGMGRIGHGLRVPRRLWQ